MSGVLFVDLVAELVSERCTDVEYIYIDGMSLDGSAETQSLYNV